MRLRQRVGWAGVMLCAVAVPAQNVRSRNVYEGEQGMPFAMVQGASVRNFSGDAGAGEPMQTYASAHPGHYLLFAATDGLHRMDEVDRMAELERVWAPMLPLEARQQELAALMRPLSGQQRVLAAQQKAALGDPVEQGRLGAEQGRIGQQMGKIGREQGEVGRKQGELGRAFYQKVQGVLTGCLQDGHCPRVAP